MYPDLRNKVAVVTGGSSGLGLAIVERFLDEGMRVIINYHSEEHKAQAADLAERYNEDHHQVAHLVYADVSTEEGVQRLYDSALDAFDNLHVWVNNAGMEIRSNTHETSLSDWNKQLNVNLTGVFLSSRIALQHFMNKDMPGSIINMSSVHERVPWPTFAAYSASKGGVKLLTETVALEYAKRQIRVNAIAPGAIATPINAEKFSEPEALAQTEALIPAGFVGEPKHVAACAAWLASEEASYVTGITLFVDGGMKLYPAFEEGDG